MTDPLLSLSPLDGRYHKKCQELSPVFSEYGFIKHRLEVEIKWLIHLANNKNIPEIQPLSASHQKSINKLWQDFSATDAKQVKKIEQRILHDMKSVELWLSQRLSAMGLESYTPFVHFGCTSEDINNLSYGLMIKSGRDILHHKLLAIHRQFISMAREYADVSMVARTHGQGASPTTLGKEMAVFAYRLWSQQKTLMDVEICGKLNGATGNYNTWHLAYPQINWQSESKSFVTSLGLKWNPYTTQIESHDNTAQLLHAFIRVNMILVDFCRDTWGYIALDYFGLKKYDAEVGSSTMPHKINPEKFENSEGNLEFATAGASFLAARLPLSRWQRDLSDSTLQRNLGSVFGYCLLGYDSCLTGIERLTANKDVISADLKGRWQLLTEGVQTLMRKAKDQNAYEKVKEQARGTEFNRESYEKMVRNSGLDEKTQNNLLKLSVADYTGLASSLAKNVHKHCK